MKKLVLIIAVLLLSGCSVFQKAEPQVVKLCGKADGFYKGVQVWGDEGVISQKDCENFAAAKLVGDEVCVNAALIGAIVKDN